MSKTTLVIGAGVSNEYDYPLGSTLITQIKDTIKKDQSLLAQRFIEDITALEPYSIDAFLRDKPQYDDMVKMTIARILLEKEDINSFPKASKKTGDHFYRFLFHNLSEADYENFNIITFNYDRSLEFYFSRSLQTLHDCSQEEAFKKLSKLKIIHIHGRLPAMPGETAFQLPTERQQLYYGGFNERRGPGVVAVVIGQPQPRSSDEIYREQLDRSVRNYGKQNFTTIYQNNDVNEDAKSTLSSSDRIFFLGFGYHDLNMQILGFDFCSPTTEKKIIGTSIGLKNIALRELKKKYSAIQRFQACNSIDLFTQHISLKNPELDNF